MGLGQMIYGPIVRKQEGVTSWPIAPFDMNRDDLADLVSHFKKNFDEVLLAAGPHMNAGGLHESIDEILRLPPYDRQNISITLNGTGTFGNETIPVNLARVVLNFYEASFIDFMNGSGLTFRQEGHNIAAAFWALESGVNRRIPAQKIATGAKLVVGAVLASLFSWACVLLASVHNLPLLIVIGIVLTYIALTASETTAARVMMGKLRRRVNRLTFQDISRVEFESDRRNRRADLKATLRGIVLGAILTVVGMVIVRSIFG